MQRGSGEAKVDHGEDLGKDWVKAHFDPGTGGKAATSSLKGQTEEGNFGSRGASVFCHVPVCHLRRDTPTCCNIPVDNAHATPGGWRVGPAEVTDPDVFQKLFVSCGGLGSPLPFH